MHRLEGLREKIRALGWQINEIAIEGEEAYNTCVGSWRIDGMRCGEKLVVEASFLLVALEDFYKILIESISIRT